MEPLSEARFGDQDISFQAAGGFDGIAQTVNCFYDLMEQLPEAEVIRAMHSEDLAVSRDKLIHFLCGWLGGPKTYRAKYGPTNIPRAHQHLPIREAERDAWLQCMQQAIEQQPYTPSFKAYLLHQLSIPAERVKHASEREAKQRGMPQQDA
ncbi:group II truncated hemoglobin [filamentous cyanobacterium LEGE 11480]|uniref:Group II truncated hemoglobin n=1 Tax=Romeriopsis navalis LEGE 11480 TaxID=2777977 RepID=A0A928VR34_9CYAN|nr:group II truncated hemoglobin [Romeriopsis navalis]MBE9030564.1 group II truncated hemoglobin [Romeriopsis navalis LEGE 11480]